MSFVSVVIITRNKKKDLEQCLRSLVHQSITLDELMVVDNNSVDDTKSFVKNFSQKVTFPVNYVLQKKTGYPYARNKGLTKATGDWIAFIDDDCIANVHWFRNIKKAIEKFTKASAILGSSEEFYRNNIFSLAKLFIDEVGKIGAIQKKNILDLEVLDSKNIVYNRLFLTKNKIKFDENLLKYAQGASEDCDLGMQIYQAGGKAMYFKSIKVVHKNLVNFFSYFKKIYFTLKNHLVYEKKWQRVRADVFVKRPLIRKINLFRLFRKKYNLSMIGSFLLLFIVFVSFVYIKLLRIILKSEINKMKIAQK